MATKQVSNTQQPFQLGDRAFIGIDTYTAANRLPDGYFQTLDNILVYGNSLQPRNGWSTCWHSSTIPYNATTGSAVYELTTLKDKGSKSKIVFASNSNIYSYDTSTYGGVNQTYAPVINRLTGTTLTTSVSSNVRMTPYGRYVYGVDGVNNPFRMRMNGQIVEADRLPTLTDCQKYTPKATASTINVMPGTQISNSYSAPLDLTGFSSAPSTLGTLITNGNFASSTATGFGQWNYNTGDALRVSSVVYTLGASTYNVFAPNTTSAPYTTKVKNTSQYILTRDGSASNFCLKIDHIQDVIYQDIDVRSVLVTYDEQPLFFTASVSSPTITTSVNHGLALGQSIKFTTTTGGVGTSTIYYVKSVPSSNTFTVTTNSIITSGTNTIFGSNVLLGDNTILIQHNAGTYVLTFYVYNQDDLNNFVSNNTLDVFVRGYQNTSTTAFSSNDQISGAEVYYSAQPAAGTAPSDWRKFQVLVDFREFDKQLTGLQVRIGAAFDRGGDSFVFLDDVSLHATNSQLQPATIQDDSKKLYKLNARQSNTTFVSATLPTDPFANLISSEYIKINIGMPTLFTASIGTTITTTASHNFTVGDIVMFSTTTGGTSKTIPYYVNSVPTTTTFTVTTDSTLTGTTFLFSGAVTSGTNTYTQKFDLRTTQSLSVRAFFSEKINQDVPIFSLGIRTDTTTEFTGQCRYDKNTNYLSFDLYPISAATRTLVSTILLKFDYDVASVYDNEWVISIGEVVKQGALTPQTKYSYAFTLWNPYTAPVNGSSPYWGTQTFSTPAGPSTTTLTTSTNHKLGVNKPLTFTTGIASTPAVVAGTTYYVNDVLSYTTFSVSTAPYGSGTVISFPAGITSGTYTFTATPDLPSADGFETSISKFTPEVVVTEAVNKMSVELATVDLQVGVDHYYKYACVYRKNILTGDDVGRLIGIVDLDTGNAYSDGKKWEGFSSSKTGTTITVTDQVPDSQMFFDNGSGTRGYRYRFGKDQYTAGGDCIAVYNQRLFISKKNTIYASWLLNTNNEYGIYTTLISDVTDPEVAIKGAQFSVSNQTDEEQIMGMITIQGDGLMRDNSTSAALVIMREHTTYLLTGDSPHNFANQGFLQGSGSGLVAKRGCSVLMGRLILTTANGVMELQNTILVPRGQQLEGILNIRSQDYINGSYSYVSAAAYANCVMCVHDRRLLLLAPEATTDGTTPSLGNPYLYIYDTRTESFDPRNATQVKTGGWVRWLNPARFTSLIAVETSDDTQDLYAGGADGKLYKLDRFEDGVYSNASANRTYTGINWTIKTRKYGQAFSESNIYYSANKLHALNIHFQNLQTDAPIYSTWLITGQKGYTTGGTFRFPNNTDKVISIRSISRTADQQTFDIKLSATTNTKWKMFAIHALTTEGNTPRS